MSDYPEFENKMKKTCEALSTQYATIRAGRANAAVLDQIQVDYYGVPTPIQQVASIATPDPRSLLIQPWDGSILKGIEKSILASDLGINPQNDGRMIRLVFPPLTEERRKDLVKQTKKYAEEAKVAIRNIRRDAIEKFKKQQKASEITEDDYKIAEKDIQKLTDDYIKEIDNDNYVNVIAEAAKYGFECVVELRNTLSAPGGLDIRPFDEQAAKMLMAYKKMSDFAEEIVKLTI